jgi:hypothetical protein
MVTGNESLGHIPASFLDAGTPGLGRGSSLSDETIINYRQASELAEFSGKQARLVIAPLPQAFWV